MNTGVDFIGKNGGQGEVASLMSNGLDAGTLRPFVHNGKTYISVYQGGDREKEESYKVIQINSNGTLRRDEWKALDMAVTGIAEKRLTGINDLISRGLTYNLGNGLATTVLESHTISDALDAELSMDGVTKAKGDRQEFGTTYLPLPIIHADYEINERVLLASRNMGNGLDVSMAERATRKVTEKLEKMLFTDTQYKFGGGQIYSYVNYPTRIPFTLTDKWDDSGMNGKKIVEMVLEMKQKMIDNFQFGPYVIYVPTGYETILDADYSDEKGTNTIKERILKISNISDIKVVDTLASDNILMVQMTSDVIRLVRGMGIQNVQWKSGDGFVNSYKVMTIQVPQIRSDFNGRTGILHAAAV